VCQIPKDEVGPPTFVLEKVVVEEENPPDPTPGLIRIPTFWEELENACPNLSSCEMEL